MATMYALYCVKVRVGWSGVIVSINLSFLSNDLLSYVLQWCDNLSETSHFDEHKESEAFAKDDFSGDCDFSAPADEAEKVHSCKSSSTKSSSKTTASPSVVNKQNESPSNHVVREEVNSPDEMKRILGSKDHYDALGFSREKKIDVLLLKKEYRKKVYDLLMNLYSVLSSWCLSMYLLLALDLEFMVCFMLMLDS